MISQRCPVCGSSRIRRGYRPTRIWSKLLFRYNLLCDKCNWEFVGFALPQPFSAKSGGRGRASRSSINAARDRQSRDSAEEIQKNSQTADLKKN